jgi:hypothetical protein
MHDWSERPADLRPQPEDALQEASHVVKDSEKGLGCTALPGVEEKDISDC